MASDLVAFLTARYAEEWSDARDRELAAGVDTSRGTREVDAKRAILASYAEALRILDGHREVDTETVRRETLEWACRTMAAIYSDHQDYRQEWAAGQ